MGQGISDSHDGRMNRQCRAVIGMINSVGVVVGFRLLKQGVVALTRESMGCTAGALGPAQQRWQHSASMT